MDLLESGQKLSTLYGKLFGIYFGDAFKLVNVEDFTRSTGQIGHGYRMVNNYGYQLRVNFTENEVLKINDDSLMVDSVDYWDNNNANIAKPTITCKFSAPLNIVQIWKRLASLLKRKKIGEFSVFELMDNAVNEDISTLCKVAGYSSEDALVESLETDRSSTIVQRRAFLRNVNADIRISSAYNGTFDDEIAKAGLDALWKSYFVTMMPGREEDNSLSDAVAKAVEMSKDYRNYDVCAQEIKDVCEYAAKGGIKVLNIISREVDCYPDVETAFARSGVNVSKYDNFDLDTFNQAISDFPNDCLIFKSVKKLDDAEKAAMVKVARQFKFRGQIVLLSKIDLGIKNRLNVDDCAMDNYNVILGVAKQIYPELSEDKIKQYMGALMGYSNMPLDTQYCLINHNRMVLTLPAVIIGLMFDKANMERAPWLGSLFLGSLRI